MNTFSEFQKKKERTKFLQSDALTTKILKTQELLLQQNKLKQKQDTIPQPLLRSATSFVVSAASTVLIEEHEETDEIKEAAPTTSNHLPASKKKMYVCIFLLIN